MFLFYVFMLFLQQNVLFHSKIYVFNNYVYTVVCK